MRKAAPSPRAGRHHNNGLSLAFTLLAALTLLPAAGQAAFEFNWAKHSSVGWTNNPPDKTQQNCNNFGGYGNAECDWDSGSGTPDGNSTTAGHTQWRNEIVTIDGFQYWHQVIIAPSSTTSTFRQEVYIRMGTRWNYVANSESGKEFNSGSTSFSDSGGFPSGLLGKQQAGIGTSTTNTNCEVYMGLGCDPLGKNTSVSTHRGDNTWTGNGTGNPTRAVFRMELTDPSQGYSLEVFKPSLGNKHRITQTLNNGGMLSQFEADMRNSTFADMNLPLTVSSTMGAGPGNFVNKLTFSPSVNAEYGNNVDFDMANVADRNPVKGTVGVETGKSTVTAGRYTFTAGQGWKADGSTPTYWATYYQGRSGAPSSGDFYNNGNFPIYDRGTYSFWQGGFDQHAVDFYGYFISGQNVCGGDPFC